MNKIIYNLNTYQLIEIDFSQILVVGQENAINIDLYFKNGDVFKVDTDWQVWLTFERPDGESTNITLATLNNDHYSKKIGTWFTAVDGIGKIFTIIKVNGETIAPFAVAKVQIFEGGTPSDDTISQEQYNELLSNINDVNNKLENHINDKNNPHEVTPKQLNVYEKEHVNVISDKVDNQKLELDDHEQRIGNVESIIDGAMLDVKIDNTTITRNDDQELEVSDLVINDINSRVKETDFTNYQNTIQDFLNGKLDKKPDGVIDLINAFNKIDARYLEIDNEIFEVVSVLPATGVANKIYLVPSSDPKTQNALDEFIWVNSAWEKIGSVSVDLSNYFNKTEINSMLGNKVDKNATITAGTHPKITYDTKGLVTGGGALVADDIPNLTPSKITQNASNRFVTDVEKNTWNGKQNKLTAGTNITIDENTNVISASGGMATVTWQDVENKPELYDKSEIDLMLGDIGNALDAILGV